MRLVVLSETSLDEARMEQGICVSQISVGFQERLLDFILNEIHEAKKNDSRHLNIDIELVKMSDEEIKDLPEL